MFGYVTVYKPELKIKEYEAYRGIYCTLCKEMGKEYGILSRFLLSYDGAFYVLFKMGTNNTNVTAEKSRCTFNPCKKCTKITCDSEIYELASTITVILAYFKYIDNLQDSKPLKKFLLSFLKPYFSHLIKKAKKKHKTFYAKAEMEMNRQFNIEKEDGLSIDEYAHRTGLILSYYFNFRQPRETRKLCNDFGYQLGRAVYFLDAFDDYEDDMKTNSFNPFKNSKNLVEDATRAINLSTSSLSQIYEQLEKNQFSPIIENVIYDGLNYQLQRIIKKYRGENIE